MQRPEPSHGLAAAKPALLKVSPSMFPPPMWGRTKVGGRSQLNSTPHPCLPPQGGKENSGLHLYSSFVAVATFLLVIAGGLVTSTGSSLAVPDWPLSNGQFFPKMEGGVLFEHGHRLLAGTVGLLTFILAGWLIGVERRPVVKYLGLAAAVAVCLQAVLGGVTVLYRLPVLISVAHACLGQIFFCLVVSVAVLTGSSSV